VEAGASVEGVEDFYAKFEKDGDRNCPCPQCGFVQISMIGGRFSAMASCLTIIAFLIQLGFALGVMFDATDRKLAVTISAIIGIVMAAIFTHEAFYDPNRRLRKNQDLADKEVDRGRLELLKEGDPDAPSFDYPRLSGLRILSPVLAWASAALTLAGLSKAVPIELSLLGGIVLLALGASALYYVGTAWKRFADNPRIDEIDTTVEKGSRIPQDFKDFVKSAGSYKADWPMW
jgi:hypothetical protein